MTAQAIPSGPSHEPNLPPAAMLQRLLQGDLLARAIHTVAELGVADILQDGSLGAEEVAARVGAHPRALYRVMRALASVGIFAEDDHSHFTLTPVGQLLRSDPATSQRQLTLLHASEFIRRAKAGLPYSVRTGKTAFEMEYGEQPFSYFQTHPEDKAVFDAAMTAASAAEVHAVVHAYDCTDIHTLVDVGGGQGTLLAALLTVYPTMRGVLFDRPETVGAARRRFEDEGLIGRVDLIGGDFFQEVPSGADAYVLKNVIHDWADEAAVQILRTCRRAIQASGRLLIVEPMIPPPAVPSLNSLFDLILLVGYGGRSRTEAEHGHPLAAAGFSVTRAMPTPSRLSILLAAPRP